jgi:response regulator RpfG family c-di-GMP phosphodiesterase
MMDNDTQKILSNLTILYIEDEDNIRKSMEQTLNMLFFKVINT